MHFYSVGVKHFDLHDTLGNQESHSVTDGRQAEQLTIVGSVYELLDSHEHALRRNSSVRLILGLCEALVHVQRLYGSCC